MDLNSLLKDWIGSRLAWLTIRREKEEALLTALVADVEALKAGIAGDTRALASILPKRGPGRPAKVEEAA